MFSKKQIFGVLAAAALVTSMVGAPAHATDLIVTAGTLDFDPAGAPTIGDFSGVTLNGTPQLTSLSIAPFTIVDATGSGAGWHVLLTIPDLDDGTETISSTNISMTAPVVRAAAGSPMGGVTANAAANFTTAQKIVVATATNGGGTYLVSPRILKLVVPQNTIADTYTSAAVIAVVSGP